MFMQFTTFIQKVLLLEKFKKEFDISFPSDLAKQFKGISS